MITSGCSQSDRVRRPPGSRSAGWPRWGAAVATAGVLAVGFLGGGVPWLTGPAADAQPAPTATAVPVAPWLELPRLPTPSRPVQPRGTRDRVAAAGPGAVLAWGINSDGQLGDATYLDTSTAVAVQGLSGVTALTAGLYHSLALRRDGSVVAWGLNNFGQLGDGTNTTRNVPGPVALALAPGDTAVAIAAGAGHSLALTASGAVYAWGTNGDGQLGDGTVNPRPVPVQVRNPANTGHLTNVVAIAAGGFHSLAVAGDGTVYAWGGNGVGQLGDGTTTPRVQAVPVLNLTGITAVAAGAYHSLALGPDFPPPTVTPQPTATTPYAPPATTTGFLVPITPVRVLDTRSGFGGPIGFDGATGNPITAAPFQEGDLRSYRVAGKTFQGVPIPAGAKGVNFNVTAVQAGPTGGFVTVFPGGASLPATSSLNPSGVTGITANAGFTGLDAVGNLQIKSVGGVRDIILDVTGYYQ